MKILVTGATGFLGSNLCPQLRFAGHEVDEVSTNNADLTETEWYQPFLGQVYDEVYHLAAWTQAGDFCLRHPGEHWLIKRREGYALSKAGTAAL